MSKELTIEKIKQECELRKAERQRHALELVGLEAQYELDFTGQFRKLLQTLNYFCGATAVLIGLLAEHLGISEHEIEEMMEKRTG